MTDVHLQPQPRIDVLVTDYETEERRLRTDYAGVAYLGDEPDPETGLMGGAYTKRDVDSRLFLPDTHWYDADQLESVEVQVTAGVLQVASTERGTQGLLGALVEPEVEFYEHPEGAEGVGVCLWFRGAILSNVAVSYRITVVADPIAVQRKGATDLEEVPAVS
ncbi:hypothetical protein O7635_33395 [Asanoa sp. WMMD1127]|uniref:hypothetical protein n=1 Tax=Asanoa sp. WMMD1127 TaxID=3016107 RepID=UPI0024172731|nr:hypothetical protein [Asanoa sp. WMMD1127]MDG4826772.1 hypothetical protein [Asanoa sp. WMMD1127]